MLQSLNKLHGSSLDFLQYVHFLPLLGKPGLDKATDSQGWVEGRNPLFLPAGKALPNALEDWPTWETKAEKMIHFYATIRSIISDYQTLDQVKQEFKLF